MVRVVPIAVSSPPHYRQRRRQRTQPWTHKPAPQHRNQNHFGCIWPSTARVSGGGVVAGVPPMGRRGEPVAKHRNCRCCAGLSPTSVSNNHCTTNPKHNHSATSPNLPHHHKPKGGGVPGRRVRRGCIRGPHGTPHEALPSSCTDQQASHQTTVLHADNSHDDEFHDCEECGFRARS